MIRTALVWAAVIIGWIVVTAAIAHAVPPRDDAPPDLSLDEKWMLRTPPNPQQYDKVRAPVQPTTTTVAARPNSISVRSATPGTTQPRPPPTAVSTTPGVEQWRGLVALYPWPVETMLAIMRCESGGNPAARNRSGASGLFQLLPGPPGWQDPATNIRLAYEMKYVPSGLSPWDASRGCWG